jgi:hypothetical protein
MVPETKGAEPGRCMLWRAGGEFDVRLWHLADFRECRSRVCLRVRADAAIRRG